MDTPCDSQAKFAVRLPTPAQGSPRAAGVFSEIQPLPAFLQPNQASQLPLILLNSGLGGGGPAWLLLESD